MKNAWMVLALVLVVSACDGTTPDQTGESQQEDASGSPWGDPEPAEWESISVSEVSGQTAGDALMAWLDERDEAQGLGMEFNRLEIVQDTPEEARVLLDGLRDDSLQAQEFEIRLEEQDGLWRPVAVQRRWVCRRGVVTESQLCR